MNSKKTIVYIRTDYSPEELVAGGSVSHTLGVIEGMIQLGYGVLVASSVMLKQYENTGVEIIKALIMPKKLAWLKTKMNCLLSNFFFTRQIVALLKHHHVDFLYQRYTVLNCTGVLISRWYKIPLILEYNGSEVWLDMHWSQKKIIKVVWLMRLVEWINIRAAHQIVVVSKPLRDELVQRGVPDYKILINPNGVNTARLDPDRLQKSREQIRMLLDIEHAFVFGFVGTFSAWHGITVLAAIIPEILKSNPQVHFLLIWDGPLLSSLKQAVKDYCDQKRVTFTGLVPLGQAQEYLSACDAFLSPTQPNADGTPFFGSPTKLFEYLSLAKPIIASEIDQVAEVVYPALKLKDFENNLVIENQVGVVVHPSDIQGFIRAACHVLELDTVQRERMGFNGRRKALDLYDWKSHVQQIMQHPSIQK